MARLAFSLPTSLTASSQSGTSSSSRLYIYIYSQYSINMQSTQANITMRARHKIDTVTVTNECSDRTPGNTKLIVMCTLSPSHVLANRSLKHRGGLRLPGAPRRSRRPSSSPKPGPAGRRFGMQQTAKACNWKTGFHLLPRCALPARDGHVHQLARDSEKKPCLTPHKLVTPGQMHKAEAPAVAVRPSASASLPRCSAGRCSWHLCFRPLAQAQERLLETRDSHLLQPNYT